MTNEELPAIEILPEVKRNHSGEAQGGPTTLYRLRLLSAEEIAAHGLKHYLSAPKVGEDSGQRKNERE